MKHLDMIFMGLVFVVVTLGLKAMSEMPSQVELQDVLVSMHAPAQNGMKIANK